MTADELKLSRLNNQYLLSPAPYRQVVRGLCGVQAQFLSNAVHALIIRSGDFSPEHTEGLVKNWTIRGTMHVFDESDLPLFLHRGRRGSVRPFDTMDSDRYLTGARKQYFAELILSGVGSGLSLREELKAACAAGGMTESEAKSAFDPWGGIIRALCESGRLCHRVQEKKAYCLCPPFEPMEAEEARLEILRRYFLHFGPATLRDAAYFFGWSQSAIRPLLCRLCPNQTEYQGKTYFYLGQPPRPDADIPDCIFLAGFDQLLMGFDKTQNPFLPERFLRNVFSLAGIVFPTVLLRGEVRAKWKRQGKKLLITPFAPISASERRLMEDYAGRMFPGLSLTVQE